MVESIICRALSEASLSDNAASMTSQTPASVQRRYWRWTEFQWPNSAGRSRHGTPVRVTLENAVENPPMVLRRPPAARSVLDQDDAPVPPNYPF
jgi:hypothetical protein